VRSDRFIHFLALRAAEKGEEGKNKMVLPKQFYTYYTYEIKSQIDLEKIKIDQNERSPARHGKQASAKKIKTQCGKDSLNQNAVNTVEPCRGSSDAYSPPSLSLSLAVYSFQA
jgi:hypothetical protein